MFLILRIEYFESLESNAELTLRIFFGTLNVNSGLTEPIFFRSSDNRRHGMRDRRRRVPWRPRRGYGRVRPGEDPRLQSPVRVVDEGMRREPFRPAVPSTRNVSSQGGRNPHMRETGAHPYRVPRGGGP